MSGPLHLFVLFVDELSASVWKPALTSAAQVGGWDVVTGPVDNWPSLTDRCVVLSDDTEWRLVIPGTQAAVIMMGPPSWEGRDLADPQSKADIALESARLARASDLVQQGAVFVDAGTQSFTLSLLGEVARDPVVLSVPTVRSSPLDIYRSIPPRSGASAIWPAECLMYPLGEALDGAAGPDMDLTGRARILFHGPHLYLTEGLWRVTVQISVDPEGGVSPLRFEWKHGDSAVVCEAPINQPGRYELQLERRWEVTGPSQIT
ncbi:hypothetical protein, partial [Brevundimonas sp.]|uniref:hypothetical protein n=1 Tax=Brevundimonas sp. TaxID=1871086 RepID=UPI0037834FF4